MIGARGGEGIASFRKVWGNGENDIRWNRAGIVELTLRAVGVDDHETSGGGVEKTVGSEEVQSHNITPGESRGKRETVDKNEP